MTGGRLSNIARATLESAYNEELTAGGSVKALRMLQKLILTTPEFHTTSVFNEIEESRPEPPRPDPPTNPYKALVYVNLNGGMDSFNVLVPHSNCIGNKGKIILACIVCVFNTNSSRRYVIYI